MSETVHTETVHTHVIDMLLREAYLYPRATTPEGLVPDLADEIKRLRAELVDLKAELHLRSFLV